MAGRLCLIKAVFTTIPLFYLSFYKALVGVCKTIRRIQAKFLWSWGFDGKKIAWVTCDKVCAFIDNGGLGVKYVGNFNDVLLAK